jgi:erythromycin esterase-like protein
MDAVINYLEQAAPEALETARQAYRCFEPFGEDERAYAYHTAMVPESCEDEVVRLLSEVRGKVRQFPKDGEAAFSAEQNAIVMRNAEKYYRAMVRGDNTWNFRDIHMADSLDRLMELHGPHARAVVWAHNTHIGDARATNMARAGMVNIGQLVRERHAREGVVLIGFGSYKGSVIAARRWGAPMERMPVPDARQASWEDILHRAGDGNKILIPAGIREREEFSRPRAHRAIGVVYNPEQEKLGNYVPTILPERYDAFMYLDETKALHPLDVRAKFEIRPPQTYPWGL